MTDPLDIYESDLRSAGYQWECCESCHDDQDAGYPMNCQLGPGRSEMECCCRTPKIGDAEWRRIVALRDVKVPA